ncbi:cytochrome P450 [Clohesyomyces aquaticus]|uniref:Cytochrome P450 n=1 Tax=Clohesyomyces aquaticus TaxID=1231657 RepID=A0A1Y1ZF11_9PLEO|nr:cytochrome P450 [Clohesyomyces aquaticus]
MLSPAIFICVGVVAIIFLILLSSIRSPLSHIPRSWHTRFSGLSIKGRRIHCVHALHQKYGDIIRLTPTKVSVAEPNAVTQIHRIGDNFLKSRWYESTHKGRDPGILAMQNPTRHAQRRRLFARAFSHTSLTTNWEATVREKVTMAIHRIKECATEGGRNLEIGMKEMDEKNGADVMKWWALMATDVIARLAFGESFHMLEIGRQTPYIDAVQRTLLGSVIRHEIPFVWLVPRYLPVKNLRALTQAKSMVFEYGERAIQNMRREGGGAQNLFGQMEAAAEKDDGMITDEDVKAEAGNLIATGSDTTAVTLTYLVWAVLKQPALQRDLEAEIASLGERLDLGELIKNAPLLNSVIEETLRPYRAALGALPRMLPKGGARFAGFDIAAGVEVSTQAFSFHRDLQAWPEPLRFNGYRFIDKSAMTPTQKALMQSFSAGSRVCIRIHLAWMELRLGAAMFFWDCRGAQLAPYITDDMIEIDNQFLIAPKGHCCYVVL